MHTRSHKQWRVLFHDNPGLAVRLIAHACDGDHTCSVSTCHGEQSTTACTHGHPVTSEFKQRSKSKPKCLVLHYCQKIHCINTHCTHSCFFMSYLYSNTFSNEPVLNYFLFCISCAYIPFSCDCVLIKDLPPLSLSLPNDWELWEHSLHGVKYDVNSHVNPHPTGILKLKMVGEQMICFYQVCRSPS